MFAKITLYLTLCLTLGLPVIVRADNLDDHIGGGFPDPAWPALINGGAEIISAGEPGSYLTVFKDGDGYVTYCGLPLLEMAEKPDVEAIHLTANLLNFGYGN